MGALSSYSKVEEMPMGSNKVIFTEVPPHFSIKGTAAGQPQKTGTLYYTGFFSARKLGMSEKIRNFFAFFDVMAKMRQRLPVRWIKPDFSANSLKKLAKSKALQ